jgi:DNA-binding beta-propeller fold protein YncE
MGRWKKSPTNLPKVEKPHSLLQKEEALAEEIVREEARLEALEAVAASLIDAQQPHVPYEPPVVRPIPVPPTPESVCLAYEKHLYASSNNKISVLDPLTGTVENAAAIGGGDSHYDYFTFDPATGKLYVNGDYGVNDVEVYDIMGHLLYTLSFSENNDKKYHWFTPDPDRHLMYMYDWYTQDIDIMDTDTDELIGTTQAPYTIYAQLLDPVTGDLYLVSNIDGNDGQILRLDGVTHELSVLRTIPMDMDSFSAVLFVYDRKIYLTPQSPEGLYVYDIDANTWTELVDDEIYYPVYDEVQNRIYMLRSDEIHVYDVLTGDYYMAVKYPEGGGFNGTARAFDPDTQTLYLVTDNEEVIAYDTTTWQQLFVTPPLDLYEPLLVLGKYCTQWS